MKTKLATTREELQELEKKEFGAVGACINWKLWDKLVEEGRKLNKQIEETFKKIKEKKPTKANKIYVYNTEGQFIREFDTSTEVEKFFKIDKGIINQYLNAKKPYIKERLFFSRIILDSPPIFAHGYSKSTPKYVYTADKKTYIGRYDNSELAAKALNIPLNRISYIMHFNIPDKKRNLYFTDKPL